MRACILPPVLSTILFIGALSQPPRPAQNPVPKPYRVEPFKGASGPTRASVPAQPVVVETPKPKHPVYTVDTPDIRLPPRYPKDLQQQFHKNYRRDDQ
jgi:hypothetical protein